MLFPTSEDEHALPASPMYQPSNPEGEIARFNDGSLLPCVFCSSTLV